MLLGYRAGYYIAKGKNTIVGAGILGLATDTAVLRIGAGEETYIHGNKDGNIGIGADASTAYKLKVTGDIHTTGKLGVGTIPSTSNKLEVNGTSLLRDDVAIGTSGTAANLNVYGTSYLKGNVGIGTTDPKAPLHVRGSVSRTSQTWGELGGLTQDKVYVTSFYRLGYYYFGQKDMDIKTGIYSEQSIVSAQSLYAVSDARKKINLGVSDKAEDLETLQQIKITNYVKKDPSDRHHHIEKKVIAQEVEEIYPTAVTQTAGLVPDVFQKQTSSSLVGTTLRVAIDSIGDLKQGDELKLLVFRDTEKSEFLHEIEKTQLTKVEGKELTFRLKKLDAETLAQQPFKVLVYGRHVKDMRTVDYDAIAMLNVSATQALAEQMEMLRTESIFMRQVIYVLFAILGLCIAYMLFRKK